MKKFIFALLLLCITIWINTEEGMLIKQCGDEYIYQRYQGSVIVFEEEIDKDRADFLMEYHSE